MALTSTLSAPTFHLQLLPSTVPRVILLPPYHAQDGPELDTAGSDSIRPALLPESPMRPRMSACDLGSFGFGRGSLEPSSESDFVTWSPACVTWREALAAAFPIMAAWPLSVSTPGGKTVRQEPGMSMRRCCLV